jgi:molybdopterin converting factor small subunit
VYKKRKYWETRKRNLLLEQQKAIAELKNQYVAKYPKLVQKYEKIYYCNRDDIVFIPGEDRYVNSSDYEAYLYNV